jgi:hypothetical protein
VSNVKHGNLTAPGNWKRHMGFLKRVFWKQERQAHERAIGAEATETLRRRGIDRRAQVDAAGDTVWPDSLSP